MSKKNIDDLGLNRPVAIALPPNSYQPSVAEQRQAHDMPGASPERVRRAFFSPVVVRREKPGK